MTERTEWNVGSCTKWLDNCHFGDCRDTMRAMIADGVKMQTIVTSPPYWGLRSYLPEGHPDKHLEIGQEPTLRGFIETLVGVFDLCRELLADDGTAWINMGDAYAGSWGSQGREYSGVSVSALSARQVAASQRKASRTGAIKDPGLKAKDLMGQPWRLAFALQDAGWYLRQEIIWNKPNPMPESVRDRCTKSHESLFLLSKNERYYFDADAIKEPAASGSTSSKRNSFARETKYSDGEHGQKAQHRSDREDVSYDETRNKRSVWTIATEAYPGAHFATFPEALVEPCVLAGSRVGDIVFDPFFGSGTSGKVASRFGRHFIACDINRDYEPLQRDRLRQPGLQLEVA